MAHGKRPDSDASAWCAADLRADDRWMLRLDPSQVRDLDEALRETQRRGIGPFEGSAADFPLPSWAGIFAACKKELFEGFGLVLVRGLPADRYSVEELERMFWGIGAHIGVGVYQNANGDLVGRVFDRQSGALGERNVRGYQTRSELGYHTDLSDVAGLLCARPAKSGGVSRIVSALRVHDELSAHAREHLAVLSEGFEYDRLGEEGPGESAFSPKVPVFSERGGQLSCRFIPAYVRSAREKMGQPLSGAQSAALDAFLAIVQRPDLVFEMTLERGDIQLVSNYTTLHSRTELVDHEEPDQKRLLLRLWLEVAGCRELDERLFLRYGKLGRSKADGGR